jgi:O-antigen/teichoic acid export membrane protein
MHFYSSIKIKIIKLMPRASFARNVSILIGGTALAQALTVIALPIITRLYTPEDFSVLALYSALLGMIGVVACLRLDIAIPLPKEDSKAANLIVLGILFTSVISALVLSFVVIFGVQISKMMGQPLLQKYLWMLPVGIWLTGVSECVQYWATRKKNFTDIAKTRIEQSIASVFIQTGMGWLTKTGPLGLLLGQIVVSGTGFIKLGNLAWVDLKLLKQNINRDTLRQVFVEYSRFPKFSTLESLANIAHIQLPIIIISSAVIGPEAGFSLLAMKSVAVPMGLIGVSVSQVYISRASHEMRMGELSEFTRKILVGLVGAGVGPLVFLGVLAPDILPMLFGSSWARAGEIVSWMTPWFIFQFLSSPTSMALQVTAHQRLALLNQVWGLFLRVSLTAWAAIYYNKYTVEIYSISGAIFYIGYFSIILRVSNITTLVFLRSIGKQMLIIVGWTAVAVFVKFVI